MRVLPDGCIDVVWTQRQHTLLVGANTSAFSVSPPSGTRVIGARFRPGAAPALLPVTAEALRDVRVAVDEILGSAGASLAQTLDERTGRVSAMLHWLQQMLPAARAPDPLVRAVVQQLRHTTTPEPSVAELARELAVSERQLRRRVRAAVGYGPKRLARVLRLASALEAARAGEELARVAFDAGYADQAHFSNDCRELAGVPPSAVLAA